MKNDPKTQREMNDKLYGAPSPGEQNYFSKGGMGPPTEAMDHQNHPYGREEDAFDNGGKGKGEKWFVDRVEGDTAVVLKQNGDTVNVPLKLLPKGAKEGTTFDAESGAMDNDADDSNDPTMKTRKSMAADDDSVD